MCLLLCLLPCGSCRTKGHGSGWRDTWGVETRDLFGGTDWCTCHICSISIPWSLPMVRQGRRGWPAACRALAAMPPTSTPHADVHASPCSCEDRQKEGREQNQCPLHPPPSRLRSPLCCLVPCSLHCLEQPWLPLCSLPSAPEPLRRRLGEWFSSLFSTCPSLHQAPRAEAQGAVPGVPPRFPQLLLPI